MSTTEPNLHFLQTLLTKTHEGLVSWELAPSFDSYMASLDEGPVVISAISLTETISYNLIFRNRSTNEIILDYHEDKIESSHKILSTLYAIAQTLSSSFNTQLEIYRRAIELESEDVRKLSGIYSFERYNIEDGALPTRKLLVHNSKKNDDIIRRLRIRIAKLNPSFQPEIEHKTKSDKSLGVDDSKII